MPSCCCCAAASCAINKAQGQTLDRVLFDARRHPHQHGHAYVLFSRARTRRDLGVVADAATSVFRDGRRVLVTSNVLYDELLSGERAARADEGDCSGCARDCARCCELMPAPRPGTLLCEVCEIEVEQAENVAYASGFESEGEQ